MSIWNSFSPEDVREQLVAAVHLARGLPEEGHLHLLACLERARGLHGVAEQAQLVAELGLELVRDLRCRAQDVRQELLLALFGIGLWLLLRAAEGERQR